MLISSHSGLFSLHPTAAGRPQADLYRPDGDHHESHRVVPLSYFDGVTPSRPDHGPYLFEEHRLVGTRPDGSERFVTRLEKTPQEARELPEGDRVVARADQHLFSLDAETGQVLGSWTSPYFHPQIYPGPEPGQVAVRSGEGLQLLDGDLKEVGFVPVKGYFDSVRPLRRGGFLLQHGGMVKVVSPKGRLRAFTREPVSGTAQEGPDGRVWFLARDPKAAKMHLVRCDPASAAKADKVDLPHWSAVLMPMESGSFLTATTGRACSKLSLHRADGSPQGTVLLSEHGSLEHLTQSGNQALCVLRLKDEEAWEVVTVDLDRPLEARSLLRSKEPVGVARLQSGELLLLKEAGAAAVDAGGRQRPCAADRETVMPGQGWRDRYANRRWENGQEALKAAASWGVLPRELQPVVGDNRAWVSPDLRQAPPPEVAAARSHPHDARSLFSTQAFLNLEFAGPDQVLDLPLPHGDVARVHPHVVEASLGGESRRSPTSLEPLSAAVPLSLNGEDGVLAASQGGTVYWMDCEGNSTFELGQPVQDVAVLPDSVVVRGTGGNLLVIHPDGPAASPVQGPPELTPAPPDNGGHAGIIQEASGVRVGGVYLRAASAAMSASTA